MPEASFIINVARTVYGLELQSIEAIEPYCSDLRGIYQVQDTQDTIWMFRLLRSVYLSDSLLHSGQLLDWLSQHHYPAPRVRRTINQQLVCSVDDWAITVLSYVDGTVIDTNPTELTALAQILGRLQRIPVDESRHWAKSRCHPDTITTAAQQLATFSGKVPEAFRPLVTNLHAAMIALQRDSEMHICITHGDCGPTNAIKTQDGGVVLIDWDQSGLGLPLLDLGNLLLGSHFDMTQPLHVEADDSKIKAIVHGYHKQNPIPLISILKRNSAQMW